MSLAAEQAIRLTEELLTVFDPANSKQLLPDKEEEKQEERPIPAHLQPFYYKIVLSSRPFGIALCKTFDEKYLCVVLPASPSGQLGLRTGSQILAINNFALESENVGELNTHFSEKRDEFLWMYRFPKISYLSDNKSMPITLYLKYEPLKILTETESLKRRRKAAAELLRQTSAAAAAAAAAKTDTVEDCQFWKQVQEDIYRWAIRDQSETWTINQDCPIVSVPPIQSSSIQTEIYEYAIKHKTEIQQSLMNGNNNNNNNTPTKTKSQKETDTETEPSATETEAAPETPNINIRTMQEFVQTDDEYKILDYIDAGTDVEVYATAGAFIQIREPVHGWIKYLDCYGLKDEKIAEKVKMENNIFQQNNNNNNNNNSGQTPLLNHWKQLKTAMPVYISDSYLGRFSAKQISECKLSQTESGNNNSDRNVKYSLNNLIRVLNPKGNKFTVIYLMGDIDFGHTLETQTKHLLRLQNMQTQYEQQTNVIVISVCCLNLESQTTLFNNQPLLVNGTPLNGILYARSQIQILGYFDLLQFQTGFFKYGLLLLDNELNVKIHPKTSINRLDNGQLFDASVLEQLKQEMQNRANEESNNAAAALLAQYDISSLVSGPP